MRYKKILLALILVVASSIRLFQLGNYPSGLNSDEAALGYNSYSLLQTSKDEFGTSWPLTFKSFNDYKPPLYVYISIPFIKIFGLNVFAIRLPSALLGIATIWLVYLLANHLFPQFKPKIGLFSALVLAISPWHIHFSRGAWEVNISTFFLTLSILTFLYGLKRSKFFVISALALSAGLYSYHSLRVIAPLMGLSLLVFYKSEILSNVRHRSDLRNFILAGLIFLLVTIPLIKQMTSIEGRSRFNGVSIFADSGPLWEALELRRLHSQPILPKLVHSKYITYPSRFIQNYYSHYSPRFLFVEGDDISRNHIPGQAQLYLILAPLLLTGLISLVRLNNPSSWLILIWLLIAPIAASLTFQSPHALRSQNMIIPLSLIIALGGVDVFGKLVQPLKTNLRLFAITFFSIILIYQTGNFLYSYFYRYPREVPNAWEYGFDQVADYLKTNSRKYDHIVISDKYDQPYIIIAFFLKYSPKVIQTEIKLTPRDKFGFSTVRSFGKFEFRQINITSDMMRKNTLLITTTEETYGTKVLSEVKSLGGQTMFKIISTDDQE